METGSGGFVLGRDKRRQERIYLRKGGGFRCSEKDSTYATLVLRLAVILPELPQF